MRVHCAGQLHHMLINTAYFFGLIMYRRMTFSLLKFINILTWLQQVEIDSGPIYKTLEAFFLI